MYTVAVQSRRRRAGLYVRDPGVRRVANPDELEAAYRYALCECKQYFSLSSTLLPKSGPAVLPPSPGDEQDDLLASKKMLPAVSRKAAVDGKCSRQFREMLPAVSRKEAVDGKRMLPAVSRKSMLPAISRKGNIASTM